MDGIDLLAGQDAGQSAGQPAEGAAPNRGVEAGGPPSAGGGASEAAPAGAGNSGGTASPRDGGDDWRGAVPEAWREALKDVGSADDALAALQRGLGYAPPASVDEVKLAIPEGVQVDEAAHKSFRELCVDKGITSAQAQALLEWQLRTETELLQASVAEGQRRLKDAWGSRYEERRGQAMGAVAALDRRLSGELAPALNRLGLARDATVIRMFAEIGGMLSEDTLAGASGAAAPDRPEQPGEAYKGMFKE